MHDGHEIFCELLFRRLDDLVLNHEFAISTSTDPLQEIERKPAEPIPVCDHKFLDSSVEYGVHHFKESFSLEVESGSDILDNFVARETFSRDVLLPFEIVFLLGRADSTVVYLSSGGLVVEDCGFCVSEVVSLGLDIVDFPEIPPSFEGSLGDPVFLSNISRGGIHNLVCDVRKIYNEGVERTLLFHSQTLKNGLYGIKY